MPSRAAAPPVTALEQLAKRHQAARCEPRATLDPVPIEKDLTDTNQTVFIDGTAVKHHLVAYRNITTDPNTKPDQGAPTVIGYIKY